MPNARYESYSVAGTVRGSHCFCLIQNYTKSPEYQINCATLVCIIPLELWTLLRKTGSVCFYLVLALCSAVKCRDNTTTYLRWRRAWQRRAEIRETMGCGGSKNAVTPSVGSSQAWSDPPGSKPASAGSSKTKPGRPNSKLIRVKSGSGGRKETAVTELKPDRAASRESLRSDTGSAGVVRGVSSATSKASAHTCDSGLEADYGYIITEESDPTLVETVVDRQRPNTPDLTLHGTQISCRKRSGKARTDQDIIKELKTQGLLSKPVAGHSGMAFDVMIAPDFGMLKKPPARLAKLKKKKTKKRTLTKEELEAKLKKAEERRRLKEAQKIEKLNTTAKEKHVHESLDASEEAQKREVAIKNASDMERVAENKEARLQAMKEKQEKRKAHAEKVRLARLARQAAGAPTQETDATDGVAEDEASAV